MAKKEPPIAPAAAPNTPATIPNRLIPSLKFDGMGFVLSFKPAGCPQKSVLSESDG
jgi:hypothetical protein